MNILHLFGDWKWTGAAEPTLNLCLKLTERGHLVSLACQKAPVDHPQTIEKMAKMRGINPITDFHMNKYPNVADNLRDIRLLGNYLTKNKIDVLHVHQSHEHLLGALAARCCHYPVAIVRTNHKGIFLKSTLGNKILFSKFTDGLITLSESERLRDAQNFGIPLKRVGRVNGAIDLSRFDLSRYGPDGPPDVRPTLGLSDSDVVVGIVARIQRHRRFDVFLKAIALAVKAMPSKNLKAVIVGRGTHRRELAIEPACHLGLKDIVTFAGYRAHDYVSVLNAFDMKVFLVPGSDGSCRAVMEAMAMGKPVIAARRGILPELVEHGKTGLVIDDTPENLSAAILQIAQDSDLRKNMGRAAQLKSRKAFSLNSQADEVEKIYNAAVAYKRDINR